MKRRLNECSSEKLNKEVEQEPDQEVEQETEQEKHRSEDRSTGSVLSHFPMRNTAVSPQLEAEKSGWRGAQVALICWVFLPTCGASVDVGC